MDKELEERLRKLTTEEIRAWTGERTADRAEEYVERVGGIAAVGPRLAARVPGTEEYTTNILVDAEGHLRSLCSCPVGVDCKHGAALALRASEKLSEGGSFPEPPPEGWLVERVLPPFEPKPERLSPRPPPPSPPPTVVRVESNPFDRFTASGGRHAAAFSFRVETPEETFHWSFVLPTLVWLIANGGFDFEEGAEYGGGNWPLFSCACGNVRCGGFGDQSCAMSADGAALSVEHGSRTLVFEFDRVRFECWVLRMLYRMRGSARLRRDPWETLLRRDAFDDALETLLAARPRCRAIWARLKEKRHFGETDFAAFAAMPPDEGAAAREDFAACFEPGRETDLREPGVLWRERCRVSDRLKARRVGRPPACLYGTVFGWRGQPVDLARGREIAFVREDTEKGPSIRLADAGTGKPVGWLKRSEAAVLAAMADRHGLVLRNHVETFERNGETLPVRIDFSFRNPKDWRLDWGDSLEGRNRLHFEMLRAVALRPGIVPAATLREEAERLRQIVREGGECPETAFLLAWILSSVREIEFRLTEEETAKRRAYCDAVRKALACEPAGPLLSAGAVEVLPLKASFADASLPAGEILSRVRNSIRLSWTDRDLPRPRVELPDFPPDATGFAVFRGRELLDACLTGVPLAGKGLFDNFALYDRPAGTAPYGDAGEAFAAVEAFLGSLPVREPGENGFPPHFWLECGIHDGMYEIGRDGRLVALRILMMAARRKWVD